MARAMKGMQLIAASLMMIAAPAHADNVNAWRPYISEAAQRFGLPERWIARVMRVESGGKTMLNGKPITSRVGAMGLMQLMPMTWATMRARLNLGSNPYDPHDNIIAGGGYLWMMYDQFGYPGLFGAYNAGPGRYAAYRAGTSRLPSETMAYIASVGARRSQQEYAERQAKPRSGNDLFYVVRSTQETAAIITKLPAPNGLFITLNSVAGTKQ